MSRVTFVLNWIFRVTITCLVGITLSAPSYAELKSISDQDMSNVTGQAFFAIDKTVNPTNSNISYTRLNMGLDIDIQTNIDKLELGRYDRTDRETGQTESQAADIIINDMSLGYIYNEQYHQNNPNVPRPKHYDDSGQLITYQDGDIVPFKIEDPFIEFAYEGDKVIGTRIGFGKAQGLLSGDIQSLTGNVDVAIEGTVNNLVQALEGQGYSGCPWYNTLCVGYGDDAMPNIIVTHGWLLGGSKVGTDANLIHKGGAYNGQADTARATAIGILSGSNFNLDILGGINFTADQCSLLGINVCFPLEQFGSLHIGKKDQAGNTIGAADGLFLSFQTQDLEWAKDINGSNTASNYMSTVQGAFFNVPTGGLQVDFVSSLNGIERARSEYIDRGRGLF